MKSELIPLNGDPPIPITRDVTIVGRREYCDVVVHHPSLSKRHCVLVRTDGLLIVRDLISTNGTKVNGQRVMWAALLPNDKLTLGRAKFKLYLGPDDALSPSELGKRASSASEPAPVPARAGVAAGAFVGRDFPAPSPPEFKVPMPSDDGPPSSLPEFEFDLEAVRPPSDDSDLEILDDEEHADQYVVELDD